MSDDKNYLRKKFISLRKKKYSKVGKFNFNLIFKLIDKNFFNKKIIIAGYYPTNYEVNILSFIKKAHKRKFKIALPVIKPLGKMSFKTWAFKDPLYVSEFGTLEPLKTNKEVIPDLVIVPLVAFDNNLNRIGYGRGYYDRILKKIRKKNKKSIFLGAAYSFQKSKSIAVKKHDFKLNCIFTELGIINSRK